MTNISEMKFDTIYSLGSRCQNSDILKSNGYREFAGIFDFMNTQKVSTLIDILEDNFNRLFSPENLNASYFNILTIDPETGRRLPSSYRTMNTAYNKSSDLHEAIFPHHNLSDQKDIEHFNKCLSRFKKLTNYNVLFNYTYNSWENDITESDADAIVSALGKLNFTNFRVCFIRVSKGRKSSYAKAFSSKKYDTFNLIINNDSYTGASFSYNIDNENYMNIIKNYKTNNRISKEEIDSEQ